MAKRVERPSYKFEISNKTGPLGAYFLAFQEDRDVRRVWSRDTCDISEAVWKWYGSALNTFDEKFLQFRKGKKPMSQGDRRAEELKIVKAITNATNEKNKERISRTDAPYSPVTINMYIRMLTAWLTYLRDQEQQVLAFDFSKEMSKMKMSENKQSRTIVLPTLLDKYLKYRAPISGLNQQRAWTGGVLLFDIGIRIDELLSLRLKDFEWNDRLVVINGKGDVTRRIGLDPASIVHLLKFKARFLDPALPNPYFFGTLRGAKKMSQDNFRRDLRVVLKKADVKMNDESVRITPHCFRHTALTATLINTNDIYKAKHMAGHANIKTTEGYVVMAKELTAKREENASTLSANSKYRQLANH